MPQFDRSVTLPVGIVIRRLPGVTRWARWSWRAVAVLPGAKPANWKELRHDGEAVEFHAATVPLELYRSDTEAYVHELGTRIPSLYVILRPVQEIRPIEVALITASPYEAQDYADSGEEIVEKVAMPAAILQLVQDFTDQHHVHEEFVKRRRDKSRTDRKDAGIGDPRIAQTSDVYRAPIRRRVS